MDEVGAFLRSRRERLTPTDVGLPLTTRRRTPGLRREEVAALAAISTDYYLRLEQGRGGSPSDQVLEALGRALRLDADERQHLRALARPAETDLATPPEVLADVSRLLVALDPLPAFAQGLLMDVVAANDAARALSPHLTPGTNLLEQAFLDPYDRTAYERWPEVAEDAVGHLRVLARPISHTARFQRLVAELSERSSEFRELWERQAVRPQSFGERLIRHPIAGPMTLRFSKLDLPGSSGVQVVVYHADPGSPSAHALGRLARSQGRPFPG
jgi:transcriptional regulator with XRE-family HTH domain